MSRWSNNRGKGASGFLALEGRRCVTEGFGKDPSGAWEKGRKIRVQKKVCFQEDRAIVVLNEGEERSRGKGRIREEKGGEGCGEGMKLEINEGLGERERVESGSLQVLGALLCAASERLGDENQVWRASQRR